MTKDLPKVGQVFILYRKKKDDIFAEEKTSSHLSESEKLYTKLKIVQGKRIPVEGQAKSLTTCKRKGLTPLTVVVVLWL